MYLRELFVENDGPIRRLHIKLDVDADGQPIPYVFVGRNGSGKTNLLSVVADAIMEATAAAYNDVLQQGNHGRNYFRILGGKTVTYGEKHGLCALKFENDEETYTFLEKVGDISIDDAKNAIPDSIDFDHLWDNDATFKKFNIDKDKAERIYSSGVYAFFPASRSEYPHWLNRSSVQPELFDIADRYTGQLGRPLFVERGLETFSQWLLGAITDARIEVASAQIANDGSTVSNLQLGQADPKLLMPFFWANMILRIILSDDTARFLWAGRKDSRKVRVAVGNQILAAGLDSLSGGQATLLSVFGTILRYADLAGMDPRQARGIVVIDELDAHMHVELQRETLPRLIGFFPGIQFLVSSHSPFFALGMERILSPAGVRIVGLPSGSLLNAEVYEEFQQALDTVRGTQAFADSVGELTSSSTSPVILVGGETDLRYFRAAARALGHLQLEGLFQWIGSVGDGGGATNSGDPALKNAVKFLKNNPEFIKEKVVVIYDCDARQTSESHGLLHTLSLPHSASAKAKKGIENLLPSELLASEFYNRTEHENDYGGTVIVEELDKPRLCEVLCGESPDAAHFSNFEPVFATIIEILSD